MKTPVPRLSVEGQVHLVVFFKCHRFSLILLEELIFGRWRVMGIIFNFRQISSSAVTSLPDLSPLLKKYHLGNEVVNFLGGVRSYLTFLIDLATDASLSIDRNV